MPVDLAALSRDVRLAARDDLGAAIALIERHSAGDSARHRLIASALHLSVTLGLLDEFLDRAVGFLKTRSSPWYGTGLASVTQDPHVLRTLGLLISRRDALDALAEDALAVVVGALSHDDPLATVGRLDIARHYAGRVARALVNEGIGLLGASSASGKHGFDRFWRDVAAHQLHYPPDRDAEAVGRDFISETRAA